MLGGAIRTMIRGWNCFTACTTNCHEEQYTRSARILSKQKVHIDCSMALAQSNADGHLVGQGAVLAKGRIQSNHQTVPRWQLT